MKKKIFNFALMGLLMGGLSLGFTACSDDDSNGNGADTEVMNPEQTDDALTAWLWVSALTDADEQVAGWQQQIYDITVGQKSDATTRVVYVTDLDEARTTFASWVGCDPKELNSEKTFSAGAYGSLTWRPSEANAQNLAVVDINSSLFRGTMKLTFCNEEQASDNAENITANCYYRLGDVVEDKEGHYWVCVQPSFLGKKNNDSYWVNVFNINEKTSESLNGKMPSIPEKNKYFKYDFTYNNNRIILPTNLKTDRKMLWNFCNFIACMTHTDQYVQASEPYAQLNNGGICNLPYMYHGVKYFKHVKKFWIEKGLFNNVFNSTYLAMKEKKINLFHHGYHWKVGSTAGVWLYKHSGNYEKNYTGSLSDDDTLYEMKKQGYGFNIFRYAGESTSQNGSASKDPLMAPAKQFVGNDGYWVVRMATGKQLDKNYSPFEAMTGFESVYRFNQEMEDDIDGINVPKDDELSDIVYMVDSERLTEEAFEAIDAIK
jgi:hypothetical protein